MEFDVVFPLRSIRSIFSLVMVRMELSFRLNQMTGH